MTAISRCLATQHPCPELIEEAGKPKFRTPSRCLEIIQECYRLRPRDAGQEQPLRNCQPFQAGFAYRRSVLTFGRDIRFRTGSAPPGLPALSKASPRPEPVQVRQQMLAHLNRHHHTMS